MVSYYFSEKLNKSWPRLCILFSIFFQVHTLYFFPPLPHLTPNLYEVAALTQEFDTTLITNKVKELLLANNLGQKIFGEAVLGRSHRLIFSSRTP